MTACPTGSKCAMRITAGILAYDPDNQAYQINSYEMAYNLIYCMLYKNFQVSPRPAKSSHVSWPLASRC